MNITLAEFVKAIEDDIDIIEVEDHTDQGYMFYNLIDHDGESVGGIEIWQ